MSPEQEMIRRYILVTESNTEGSYFVFPLDPSAGPTVPKSVSQVTFPWKTSLNSDCRILDHLWGFKGLIVAADGS